MMVSKNINTVEKNGLHYFFDKDKKRTLKPWLGDLFSPLYDRIMEKLIFPKKFGGKIDQHFDVLQNELSAIEHSRILELATGSGNAIPFLSKTNQYAGVDISPGLLKQARRRLRRQGLTDCQLYVTSADVLPFADNQFDVCLCFLSFNFFPDIAGVISRMYGLLKSGGFFFGCVPVPDRQMNDAKIRGRLLTEKELETEFKKSGFFFKGLPYANGAVFYFKAEKESSQTSNE